MKASYRVEWTQTASEDLYSIIEYIAQKNRVATSELLERIYTSANKLKDFPERCRIVPELSDNGITQYRELIIESWRIIFKIDSKTVFVLATLDSRRNLEDILLDRFSRSNRVPSIP